MQAPAPYFKELCDDIDRGRIVLQTTLKNCVSCCEQHRSVFRDYDHMIELLEEWNYVKLLRSGD